MGVSAKRATRTLLFSATADIDGLLCAPQWRPCTPVTPGAPAATGEPPGIWVIAASEPGLCERLAAALEACGQSVIPACPESVPQAGRNPGPHRVRPTPESRAEWSELFAGLSEAVPLRGVVHLASTAGTCGGDPATVATTNLADALALAQGMEDAGKTPSAGTWFVGCGADAGSADGQAGSVLQGLARTVMLELPHLGARSVDLDREAPEAVEQLAGELLRPDRETKVAWRRGERLALRLERMPRRTTPVGGRIAGTWLITGGLGGLGLEVAAWLAEHGADTIVLNGRRPPDPDRLDAIAEVSALGARVEVEVADVADPASVDALLRRVADSLPHLQGIVHAAGSLADGTLTGLDRADVEEVMAAKARGAWNLHRATAGFDLEAFVLFSSVAGVMGSAGQANYAVANAFLDRLAVHRRALGLPGLVIAWGAWSSRGMAARRRERLAAKLEATGSGWLTPRQGRAALGRLLQEGPAHAMAAPIDWRRVAAIRPGDPLLDAIVPQ